MAEKDENTIKCNFREVMATARCIYRINRKGRSWHECISAAWRATRKRLAREKAEADRRAEILRLSRQTKPTSETVSYLFPGDVYNRNSKGYMNSQYCGD